MVFVYLLVYCVLLCFDTDANTLPALREMVAVNCLHPTNQCTYEEITPGIVVYTTQVSSRNTTFLGDQSHRLYLQPAA